MIGCVEALGGADDDGSMVVLDKAQSMLAYAVV